MAQQFFYVTGLVPAVVLKLPQAVVESDHPALHLIHTGLHQIFKLVHLLRLRVLTLHH